jgi:uncharacterized protein YjcR
LYYLKKTTFILFHISESQVKQWISKYGWTLQNDGNVFILVKETVVPRENHRSVASH